MRRAAILAAVLLLAPAPARAETKLIDDEKLTLTLAEHRSNAMEAVIAGGEAVAPKWISIVYVLSGTIEYGPKKARVRAEAGDAVWQAGPAPRRIVASKRKPARILTLTVPAATERPEGWTVADDAGAKRYEILGGKGSVLILLDKDSGGDGSAYVGRISIRKGAEVAEHVHANEDEIIYVIAGKGEMTIAGEKVVVEAGMAIRVPRNTKHSFVATEDVDAVQFYAPGGPEQRFKGTTGK